MGISLTVNGSAYSLDVDPGSPLLYALQENLQLNGKFGCGLGQCGACTVLLDGQPIRSGDSPELGKSPEADLKTNSHAAPRG